MPVQTRKKNKGEILHISIMQILYLLVWPSIWKKYGWQSGHNGMKKKVLIPVKNHITSRNVLVWEISIFSIRSYNSEEARRKKKKRQL